MRRIQSNRATANVASKMQISGRTTADEINRGLRTRKERSFWCIASLTFVGSLMVAGFLAALAPLPASADNDKESRHEHEDNDKGIRADVAALQAQVAALQDQVKTLQNQLATVQSNHALLLGPFVSVDPNPEIGVIGPNIIFSGAIIHIVSGSGATDDNANPTGLGNLIIGYDEDPRMVLPNPLGPGDRGGSHNLVIGRWHRFTRGAIAGFVAGQANLISNVGSSVTGGEENTASGFVASVAGGVLNTASGLFADVSGGGANTASGDEATVLGGGTNISSGGAASVAGGAFNTASGSNTVVIGGQNVTDNKDLSIAPQPPFP